MKPSARLVFAALATLALPSLAHAKAAAPPDKYLVLVRDIVEAKGTTSGIVPEARQALLDEMKKYPELLLELPPDLPPATDHKAFTDALRARKKRAIEVVMTIVGVKRATVPPATGKRFQVLQRSITLSITGDTLPDRLVALSGDGEAEVAAEMGPRDDLDKEGKELLVEAAKTAVGQAVEQMMKKLRAVRTENKPPPTKKRK